MSWHHTPHSQPTHQRTVSHTSHSTHHTIKSASTSLHNHRQASYNDSRNPAYHYPHSDDTKQQPHALSAPRPYKPLPPQLNTRAISQPAVNRALLFTSPPPQPPPPPQLSHHSSYYHAPPPPARSHAYSPPPSHLSPSYSPAPQPLSPSSPPFSFAALPPSQQQPTTRRSVPRVVLRGMSAIDVHALGGAGGGGGRQQRLAPNGVNGESEEEQHRRRRKREGGERWERDRHSWIWGWRCCRMLQSRIGSSAASQTLPLFSPPSTRNKPSHSPRPHHLLLLLLCLSSLTLVLLLAYGFLTTSPPPPTPFDPLPLPAVLPFNIPSLSYLPTLPLPLPPPLVDSAVGERSVLLFAILRDYNEEFAASHPDEFNRYKLAITSWLSLATLATSATASSGRSVGQLDIVVFVDSSDSCAYLTEEGLAVQCEALSSDERCVHRLPSGSTRPYMHCVWERVAAHGPSSRGSPYSDYLFVNGDILLFPSLLSAFTLLHRTYPSPTAAYSLVTRRRDKSFTGLTPAALTPQQLADTERQFLAGSVLHDSLGIDVFTLSTPLFMRVVNNGFPAFLIGVYRWDNWLLAELLRTSSVWSPVVDGSAVVVAGHDSLLSDHLNDAGREWNDAIAKQLIGQAYRTGNTDNADLRIVSSGTSGTTAEVSQAELQWRLQVNVDERMQLRAFRHGRLNTLALVPVSSADLQPRRDSSRGGMLSSLLSSPPSLPALSVLQLFLCTAQRLNFTEYVLVAEDAPVYWTLLSQRHNNVVLNVNRSLLLAAAQLTPAASSASASSAVSSSLSLLSFNSTSYPQLYSSLLFLSHITKQLLSYPTHTLLLHPATTLLSHPFTHLNLSCDLHTTSTTTTTAALSPHFLLLTSHPSPHHSYPAWLMRKVDECIVREVEDVVDERRKRQRRVLRGPLVGPAGGVAVAGGGGGGGEEVEDGGGAGVGVWERYGVMGVVGRQCLQETVTFQLQALPSFVQCRDDRVMTWAELESERVERSAAAAAAVKGGEEDEEEEDEQHYVRALSPWPFAILAADDVETSTKSLNVAKALVLHSLSTQCVSPPPTLPSASRPTTATHTVSHAPIYLHVHVRSDASEQSIRLFLRSLILADYTSLLPPPSPTSQPLLVASFDITALAYSHPPSPLHLSSRISAIIDEFEQEVDGLRLTLHSRLQAAELTTAAGGGDGGGSGGVDGVLFSFSHEGEVYVSTRLVGRSGAGAAGAGSQRAEFHLFVDNGMLMPRLWYQHFLSSLAHSHVDGLLGLSLYSLPLPAALSATAATSQLSFYTPYIPLSHSLLGLILPTTSLLAFHHFLVQQPDEACDSDARTMEKVAMQDGLFLLYLTDVTHMQRVVDDDGGVVLVDVRLGEVSAREALRLEYQLWRGVRHDHCVW